MSSLWGHWYPLFRTLDDSAHRFQSQGGSIITPVPSPVPSLVTGSGIEYDTIAPARPRAYLFQLIFGHYSVANLVKLNNSNQMDGLNSTKYVKKYKVP